MTNNIKTLKTNGVNGLTVHTVGVEGVTNIRDTSIGTDQSYIVIFEVFVNEKKKYEYSNGVYEVEYFD